MWKTVTPEELKPRLDKGEDIFVLDVREPEEFAIANIGGTLIPLSDLPHRFQELPQDKTIAVLCHHGVRSARGAQFLLSQGFEDVINIAGGIDRWSQTADTSIKRY